MNDYIIVNNYAAKVSYNYFEYKIKDTHGEDNILDLLKSVYYILDMYKNNKMEDKQYLDTAVKSFSYIFQDEDIKEETTLSDDEGKNLLELMMKKENLQMAFEIIKNNFVKASDLNKWYKLKYD